MDELTEIRKKLGKPEKCTSTAKTRVTQRRAKIYMLRKEGYSEYQISKILKIPVTTVAFDYSTACRAFSIIREIKKLEKSQNPDNTNLPLNEDK